VTAGTTVPRRPVPWAERLERLARQPLQPRRDELHSLAERLRVLEALDRAHDEQLTMDAGRAA
jgi:hypothetical protein